MAGDWIKVEEATLDKPEVLAMAEMLGTTADDVVGKLLRVWFWFDKQSLNGDAPGVTNVTLDKFIDRHVASQGFAQTMRKVGWLSDAGLPNFDRHNGETAKNRALTKKRMKKMRDAVVTPTPSPEKRREEKKEKRVRASKTPLPENFGLSEGVIDWATANGFSHLQEHLDSFRLKAVAHDYRYADWDAAFKNAIKADWAKVNGAPKQRDQFAGAL